MKNAWRTRWLSLVFAAALWAPTLVRGSRVEAQESPSVDAEARCPHGPEHGRRHGHGHGRHGHGPRDVESRVQHLSERLSLDANQTRLVREIFEEARREHEALRERAGDEERTSRREAHRAVMQRTMERIDAVLTPEQRTTFEEMRARFRQHRGAHRGQGRGPRGAPADQSI